MKILHVIASMDPCGGGPASGVGMVASQNRSNGHDVEILSLDRPDSAFLTGSSTRIHALGPSRTGYRYNSRAVRWLKDNSARFDAVIVNGLWQYHGFAVHRALAKSDTPYFVFTHGMLDPWFKRRYPLKHLKKWLYWPWAEYRILRDAKAVIFTSEEERLLARSSFWLYRANEVVTAYGTTDAPSGSEQLSAAFLSAFPNLAGKRVALYLSRIHEKKGCDILIKAFSRIAQRDPALHLVIAGPDRDNLVPKLKALASECGISERITWPGMLLGDMKWGAFHSAEIFCLPSHQENFGIVVAEALACGKPVLISDKVNIWREVEESNAGIVRDDNEGGTIDALETWLALSVTEKQAMQDAARACFESRFRIDRVAESLVRIIDQRSAADSSQRTHR